MTSVSLLSAAADPALTGGVLINATPVDAATGDTIFQPLPATPGESPLSFSDLLGQAKISSESPSTMPSALPVPGDSDRASAEITTPANEAPAQSVPEERPASPDDAPRQSDRGALPSMINGRLGGASARQILLRPDVPDDVPADDVSSDRPVAPSIPLQPSFRREKTEPASSSLADDNGPDVASKVVPAFAGLDAMIVAPVAFQPPVQNARQGESTGDETTTPPRSASSGKSASGPVQDMAAVTDRGLPSGRVSEFPESTMPYAAARSAASDLSSGNVQLAQAPAVKNPTGEHSSEASRVGIAPVIETASRMETGKPAEALVTPVAANKTPVPTGPAKAGEKNAPVKNVLRQFPTVSSSEASKDNFLNIDDKDLAERSGGVGTEVAKSDITMANSFKAPQAARDQDGALPVRLDSVNTIPVPAVQTAAGATKDTEVHAPRTAEAVDVIHEVVAMTDDLRSRERSSVEVSFHFKDNARVDVRVAYRDGEVQATFRSDSPELRDTLHREWQLQAGASSSEARPYRLAEPVFLATTTTSAQPGGLGFGGDTPRQSSQQQSRPDANGHANIRQSSPVGDGRILGDTASRPAASFRPETVRHLHVFA